MTLLTLFMGVFSVEQYERGIITRNGAFLRIAEPGLGFKVPWIDSLTRFDIRETNPKFLDMESASYDQFPAKIDVSIVISPKTDTESMKTIYSQYRTVDNAIKVIFAPLIPAETKVVFGRYTAAKAFQERDKLNDDVKTRIVAAFSGNSLFTVHRVLTEDIEFSKKYMESIEQRMMAEVEVQKVTQNWEREKVTAGIVKTQADAVAYQISTKGDAEAKAIEAKTKALANNPQYIQMMQAEKWNGVLPTTVLPSTAIPMINTQK